MHVRAPFAYAVEYFVHNGRKRTQRTLIDHVERDVPQIGLDEAPVAIRWEHRGRRMDIGLPSLVRYHDGRFYQSASQTWRNQGLDEVPGAASLVVNPHPKSHAAALYSGETHGRFFDAVHHFLHSQRTQKRPSAQKIEFDLGDDHVERRMAAETRLERLLVIENDIWLRIHEPTLAVRADRPMSFEPQVQRIILTEEPRFENFGAPPDAVAHKIDQTDLWLSYREPTGKEALRICADNIRVEMPEAFSFDPVRNAMLRSVEAFVLLLGPEIHVWDDELVVNYLSIRNKLRFHIVNPALCPVENIAVDIPPILARIESKTEAYRTVSRACDYALAKEPSINIFLTAMHRM
jgi:hypothetical protein